ncbi:hypothetical protein C9J21_20390 [Photobacterium phosphoreum]|uniref:hypothetical protein n=1 Tax=Photobacterium phosphoreum TaxID=659 RepID=UPI000D174EFC|nr:hypothetical protein [Photobacterium phosphoreum]PSW28709.1 hypothetical protein C9J21_20390 [Photobacterium phosphoreum]
MNEERRKLILDTLDLLAIDWREYKLPGHDDPDTLHIIPVSGGSDSKCMSLILPAMFPNKRFIFVFTDTKAEEQASYNEFDQISEWVGYNVIKIIPEKGLYDLIDDYNGYLPSGQARYCTRILKLKSLDEWLEKKFFKICSHINLYVGIRFDEDRFGRLSNHDDVVQMRLPYLDLKMERSQVYSLLAATTGISPVYKHSSRSSCNCCFFKRNSERVMQCIEAYSEFNSVSVHEKLSDSYLEKLDSSKMFNAIISKYPNYLSNSALQSPYIFIAKPVSTLTENLPNPPKPIRNNTSDTTLDMFDASCNYDTDNFETVYIAVMFLVKPEDEYGIYRGNNDTFNGVYFTKIVNYSRNLNGLKRSLNYVYEHIMSTAELYNETQESMLRHLRIGIYEIKVPTGQLELDRVDKESYTWAGNGMSYRAIEQNLTIMQWILVRKGKLTHLEFLKNKLKSRFKEASKLPSFEDRLLEKQIITAGSVWEEYTKAKKSYIRSYNNTVLAMGEVSWSGIYKNIGLDKLPSVVAKQRKLDKENGNVEGEYTCIACSL